MSDVPMPPSVPRARAIDRDDDLRGLSDYLTEINGQDAYDAVSVAMGRIPKSQYLQLLKMPEKVAPKDVGSATSMQMMSSGALMRTALLNAEVCPAADSTPRYIFGLLRAYAVGWGWAPNEKEVSIVDAVTAEKLWADKKVAFLDWVRDNAAMVTVIRSAAFLLPFCARHVFHTTGHHYLSHDAPLYKEKYDALFKAILMEKFGELLPRELLHHTALHWIAPGVVSATLQIADSSPEVRSRLPNALYMRRQAPPAGTAIITTSAATLRAMTAPGILPALTGIYAEATKIVFEQDARIRANPDRFHQTHQAYALDPPSNEQRAAVDAAKAAAETLAPVCQAFINAYIGQGSLARAQALKKAADGNPLLLRILEQWFKAFAKSQRTRESLEALLYVQPKTTIPALEEAGEEMPPAARA